MGKINIETVEGNAVKTFADIKDEIELAGFAEGLFTGTFVFLPKNAAGEPAPFFVHQRDVPFAAIVEGVEKAGVMDCAFMGVVVMTDPAANKFNIWNVVAVE